MLDLIDSSSSQIKQYRSKKGKILICEDEYLIAYELELKLKKLGYDVVGIADHAEGAIDLAEKYHPEVALMDIRINGQVDGTEVAEYLNDNLGIPSIFLTANCSDETIHMARMSDPIGFLVKPVHDRVLESTVEFGLKHSRGRKNVEIELSRASTALEIELASRNYPSDEQTLQGQETLFPELLSYFNNHVLNQLQNVSVNLEWLSSCKTMHEYERYYSKRALNDCEKIEGLLRRVMLAHGQGVYEFEIADLNELLLESFEKFDPENIAIAYEARKSFWFSLVNPKTFKLAIEEVVSNVMEFATNAQTVEVHCDVKHIAQARKYHPNAKDGYYVAITVSDQGPGMNQAYAQQAVLPFVSSKALENQTACVGLGLSIVKGILVAHGGWLEIDSTPERGTSVILYWPQADLQQ